MKKYMLVLAFAIFSVGFLGFGKSAFAVENWDFSDGYLDKNPDNFSFNTGIKNPNYCIDNNVSTFCSNNSFAISFKNKVDLSNYNMWITFRSNYVTGYSVYVDGVATTGNLTSSGATFKALVVPLTSSSVEKVVVSAISTFDIAEIDFFPKSVIPGVIVMPVSNIVANPTDTTVTLNWKNPDDPNLSTILINGKDIGLVTNYQFKDLEEKTKYDYVITAKYKDGSYRDYFTSVTTLGDITAPNDVFNFKAEPSTNNVVLSYDLSADKDYYYSEIYRNDKLIATVTDAKQYVDSGLDADTVYKYTIYTFDKSLNKSNGSIVNVRTKIIKDENPPDKVLGLSVTPFSGGGTVSWNFSNADDLKGYNIYLNGVLFNDELIKSNSFRFTNLKNETSYTVYVTAVDTSGNESEASNEESFKPTIKAVPPVDIGNADNGYKLADISESTGNWFKSMWLIVAFAIGVVLAFIVGHRVRNLFLG